MKRSEKKATEFKVDESVSFEEQVEKRAHELYIQRGGQAGNDWSDWFRAEREITEWHRKRLTEGPSRKLRD